jgi:hypothetical protein
MCIYTKTNCVSKLDNDKYLIHVLHNEISKCRLLCKNCHFIHTRKQLWNKESTTSSEIISIIL